MAAARQIEATLALFLLWENQSASARMVKP